MSQGSHFPINISRVYPSLIGHSLGSVKPTSSKPYTRGPHTHRRTTHANIFCSDSDCPSSHRLSLTIFLICPGLRKIILNDVQASEESYDEYPDWHCYGRELPTLDSLDYSLSGNLVKQMVTPPPRFTTVVLWSKLRVLTLCPLEEEDVACLQPILDVVCNTLEELYLTRMSRDYGCDQLSLASPVNLGNLPCLHIFAFHDVARYDGGSAVLHDINLVLSTIPTSNKVTNLTFKFELEFVEEDWAGFCGQVVRIAGGKHLKLTLDVVVFGVTGSSGLSTGEAESCERINEKIASLSEYLPFAALILLYKS